MKYCLFSVVLFLILVSISDVLLAEDYEEREKRIHEEVRQHWADVNNPAPPGDYIPPDRRSSFCMTIPEGRTAESYNRKDIDTKNYREKISEAIKEIIGVSVNLMDKRQTVGKRGRPQGWRKLKGES